MEDNKELKCENGTCTLNTKCCDKCTCEDCNCKSCDECKCCNQETFNLSTFQTNFVWFLSHKYTKWSSYSVLLLLTGFCGGCYSGIRLNTVFK